MAFALPVGGVSDPMPVEGGYRIVKVTAKTSGSTTPYEAAKDKVRDRLMMSRFETAYDAYMQELRKTASVELRVREVPLQLTGPIPEGSLLEALEPLAPGAPPGARRPAGAGGDRPDRRPDRGNARRPRGRGRGDHHDAAGRARRRWRPPAAPPRDAPPPGR